MKTRYIFPPDGGWKECTWYLVEVSFNPGNPVFNVVFYSGFLNGPAGSPGGYNFLASPTIDPGYTIGSVYLMNVIRELATDEEWRAKHYTMPEERIGELTKGRVSL